jgi:S-formylglutathione hydrolase FrmB
MMDIARVMETIVRAGHSRPVLLVTPCMSNDDGSTTGLATDWASPHLITGKRARGVGTGRYHEHLFEELIPDVERRFRTMSDKYGRATDGFSLGGFMALKTALARPDLFCAAGAYDGSFFYLHHRPGGMESGDYLMDNGLFDPVFGQPRRMEHVWRNSPAAILSQLSDAELRSLSFYLQCGPQQAEPMDSNFYRTMHMVRLLQMRGLNNRAEPCVFEDGHHDWPTAFRHLAGALEHFSSIFT